MMERDHVLVGIDGSAPGYQALRWAADEARRGGRGLEILIAYPWRAGTRLLPTDDSDDAARERARVIVELAIAQARRLAPGVPVHGRPVRAGPADALLAAAGEACLTVVGSRGRGRSTERPLGSVGLRLATHASCPVVVVRGHESPGGPVVLGLNGSRSAESALPIALEQASMRGVDLLVARAYPARRPMAVPRAVARLDLAQTLEPWRDKYPDVPVEYVVSDDPAGNLLAGLSRRAELVVVASRGSNGFAGLLLGSVARHLVGVADCPVLIGRPRHGR